jgi:hypothetical protein
MLSSVYWNSLIVSPSHLHKESYILFVDPSGHSSDAIVPELVLIGVFVALVVVAICVVTYSSIYNSASFEEALNDVRLYSKSYNFSETNKRAKEKYDSSIQPPNKNDGKDETVIGFGTILEYYMKAPKQIKAILAPLIGFLFTSLLLTDNGTQSPLTGLINLFEGSNGDQQSTSSKFGIGVPTRPNLTKDDQIGSILEQMNVSVDEPKNHIIMHHVNSIPHIHDFRRHHDIQLFNQ